MYCDRKNVLLLVVLLFLINCCLSSRDYSGVFKTINRAGCQSNSPFSMYFENDNGVTTSTQTFTPNGRGQSRTVFFSEDDIGELNYLHMSIIGGNDGWCFDEFDILIDDITNEWRTCSFKFMNFMTIDSDCSGNGGYGDIKIDISSTSTLCTQSIITIDETSTQTTRSYAGAFTTSDFSSGCASSASIEYYFVESCDFTDNSGVLQQYCNPNKPITRTISSSFTPTVSGETILDDFNDLNIGNVNYIHFDLPSSTTNGWCLGKLSVLINDETQEWVTCDFKSLMERLIFDNDCSGSNGFSSITIDLLSPNTPCYYDESLTYYKDVDINNLLCENSLLSTKEWNVVKGDWTYADNNDCSVFQSDTIGSGNIIWLGLQDGQISNSNYNFYAFTLQVLLSIEENGHSSGNGNGGVLFRAKSVSSISQGGQSYYVALKPHYNTIVTGRMNDGWTILGEYNVLDNNGIELNYGEVYSLRIEADYPNRYSVYLNNILVFEDIDGSQGSTSSSDWYFGSIGLRTYKVSAKYYKVSITEWNKNLDMDCISVVGPKSGSGDGDKSSVTCSNGYKMTGCSSQTNWRNIDGSYIEDSFWLGSECVASNGNGGKGVWAYAQCCKMNSYCETINSEFGLSSTASITCNDIKQGGVMTGCTMASSNKGLYGAITDNLNTCTAFKQSNTGADLRANGRCCIPPDNNKLKCYTFWSGKSGTGDDNKASVTCPYGLQLSGCNTYSNGKYLDGAYGDNSQKCTAQNGSGGDGVYAVARCCMEYDTPNLSSLIDYESSHIEQCKNMFGISEITILDDLNGDNNGIIDYCCYQLINENVNPFLTSLRSSKSVFEECISKFGQNIEGKIKYSLTNNFVNRDEYLVSQCNINGIEIGGIDFSAEASASGNENTLSHTANMVNGALSIFAATGNAYAKSLAGLAGGFTQIAGESLFGDSGPDLDKLFNQFAEEIFDKVYEFVIDVFSQTWECTINYVEYSVANVEESVLTQLHLGDIEDNINRVNTDYLTVIGNNPNDIAYIWNEFSTKDYIWTDLRSAASGFDGNILNTRVQRSIIPLIQIAMNQRIFIYIRYSLIGVNITGINDVRDLTRGSEFKIDNEYLLDTYIEYFSGAYYDILLNSDEYVYNDIISDINSLFNTKLFCNWVYFTDMFTHANNLDYCAIDICDCNGFEQLRIDIENGIKNVENDLNDWYNNYISKQMTDYFINDVFMSSSYYSNNYLNLHATKHSVYDLWLKNVARSAIDIFEGKIFDDDDDVYGGFPRRSFILDHPDGDDRGPEQGCEETRYFECSHNKWYSGNSGSVNTIDFISINGARVSITPNSHYECEDDLCRITPLWYTGGEEDYYGATNLGLDMISEQLKCKNNIGSIIGARYMLEYSSSNDKTKEPRISGIEILCNEDNNVDYYKEYKYFNFDNRNVLLGFDRRNDIYLDKYEWSPWFICPKKHTLEILIGSVTECKACLNIYEYSEWVVETDDYFRVNDPYVSYRCRPY